MKRIKKQRSILAMISRIMIPIGIVVFVLFLIAFNNLHKAQEMAYAYMTNTSDLFIKEAKANMRKANSEIYHRCETQPYYQKWPETIIPKSVDLSVMHMIVTDNNSLRSRYGQEYQFFVYGRQSDLLVCDSAIYYKDGFRTMQTDEMREHLRDMEKGEWKYDLMYADDIYYLLSAYAKNEFIYGYYIDMESLLKKLNIDNMGYLVEPYAQWEKEAYITLSPDIDKEKIESYVSDMNKKKGLLSARVSTYEICPGMQIGVILSADEGILRDVVNMQITLLLIIAGLLLAIGYGGSYLYLRLLKPMRQFLVNLQTAEVELFLDNTGSLDIIELETVSKEFKELLRRIKMLKIAIYERSLLSQHVQMEYAQEQMQSHFYLNCLNILHGMAEEKNDERMAGFLKILSRYMRYVNNDSYKMKTIREELEHIRDYIEIQHIRYRDAFVFEADVEEQLLDCYVPTLILQTFIENSIKHQVTLKGELLVSLYITTEMWEEEEYLYIAISDNGEGFSEEILEIIDQNRPIYYDNRKHMGISNAKQRLQLIYDEKYQMQLSNMPNGNGAIVELRLPIIKENEELL